MIVSSLLNRVGSDTNDSKQASGSFKITAPANHERLLATAEYRYSDIDLAMKGAFDHAIPESFAERLEVIQKALALLVAQKEKILAVARLELGRTNDEFALEWNQTERFLSALLADQATNQTTDPGSALQNTDPRGLTVFLGSYVWPVFYTVHFAILNFLAGNALVIKPAEKASLTTLSLIEVLREIPALRGLQVMLGDREVGRRVATHESVSTILFQGSFEVGMRIRQDALSMPSKEVLLYLGAKNPAIVFADAKASSAESEKTIEALLLHDAFLGAGQHCQSVSLIFVEKPRLAEFVERFHELAKNFKIGGPDAHAFMGPLIDGAMLDRYLKFIGISEREGGEVVMRGKPFTGTAEKGHFVTPSIVLFETLTPDQLRKSVSLQTEILSPHVSIIGFETEAELLALMATTTHGKLASIWTGSDDQARRIAKSLAVGKVLINQSVYENDPAETFQARKRSGNHALLGVGLLSQLVFQKSVIEGRFKK